MHLYKFQLLLLRGFWVKTSYRTAFTLGLMSGIVGLVQFTLMGKFLQEGNSFKEIHIYGGNLLAYLITGNLFTSFLGIALSRFSSVLVSEQSMGTLEALLVSHTPLHMIMIYQGVISLINRLTNTVVFLTLLVLLFHVPISLNFASIIASLLALIFSMLGFGLASTGILLVTKSGDPITWILTTLTGLVSGVLYPPTMLPEWLQSLSRVLPTTHALEAIRFATLRAASLESIGPQLLFLVISGLITLPIGVMILHWGLFRARSQGSLGEF